MKRLSTALLSMILLIACGPSKKESNASAQTLPSQTEKIEPMKKIVFVITSHSDLGDTGEPTGVWLEEFAAPYYFLKAQGVDITLASPKGGRPPIDPKSELDDFQTEYTRKFAKDQNTQDAFSNTIALEKVSSEDYDAVFYTGGYGPLWDLADNPASIALIESFYNADKPIGSVCHGPAIFKNTRDSKGNPIVQGKKVTAYSNSEEAAINFTEIVPFSVEDMLAQNGGIYSKGPDWNTYAVEDGLLVTGQNPSSSELVAEMLLKKLN